jgi:hypothetical protein
VSRTVSAEPRDPSTVENRTNTGVSRPASARNGAFVTVEALPYAWNTPCAAAPRACTARSGIRSWSKWVIFSRRWKSSSSDGPRGPAFNEWSVSESRRPCAVVRNSPRCNSGVAATGAADMASDAGLGAGGVGEVLPGWRFAAMGPPFRIG